MPDTQTKPMTEILEEDAAIEAALERAFWKAVRQHKQAGLPMVFWKDGKIVWVPPEELPTPDDKRNP